MASPSPTSAGRGAVDPEEVNRFRLAVVRLARQIRQNARTGVTPSQSSLLFRLDRHGPLSLGELAEHEGLAKSTITRLVRSVEEAGLVLRRPHPDDGRASELALTDAGRQLVAESRARASAFMRDRVAALSVEDQDLICRVSDVLERLGQR